MMNWKYNKCFFCGEENPIVLEEYNIIDPIYIPTLKPKEAVYITVCQNCKEKLRFILRKISKHIKPIYDDYIKLLKETGKIKIEEKEETKSEEEDIEEKARRVYYIIISLTQMGVRKRKRDSVSITELQEVCKHAGISRDILDKALDFLKRQGLIYEPNRGRIAPVCWLIY